MTASVNTVKSVSRGAPTLAGFFAVVDAWELSDIQTCQLLKCPSVAVLRRYRLGQGPRLTPIQQKRIQLVIGIQAALVRQGIKADKAFRYIHEPRPEKPFKGDTPIHFMMHGGVDALLTVARLVSDPNAA
jgi:hypothetical protein